MEIIILLNLISAQPTNDPSKVVLGVVERWQVVVEEAPPTVYQATTEVPLEVHRWEDALRQHQRRHSH